MRISSFLRSGVLVIGPNSIQSLVPSNLVSQVESLLEFHKIPEAIALVDQQRVRLQQNAFSEEDELDELRYVYQRIGFQCLSETRFEEAGELLFNGELDPRVLVSFFPEVRGNLFTPTDSVGLFSGIAESMPAETSVEDIIRNYSPHLAPGTRSAPPTTELRKIYLSNARDMLEKFLRKWRSKQRMAGTMGGSALKEKAKVSILDIVIDTVLAKLFALAEKTNDLYTLLKETNDVDIAELEAVLQRTGQYNALCILYRQAGDHDKLLDALSKIADGQWTDDDIHDPITDMISILNGRRDKALTQKWGIWITKKDPEKGLKLLMSGDSGKRRNKQNDELVLLQELKEANPAAGDQFLEHLVLQKRSTNRDLHNQLAAACVDQLISCLADATVSKLWRAKASSYSSSPNTSSFISYFASTTPDSDSKRTRLKTALFLQGSSYYDPRPVLDKLSQHKKFLSLELAIVHGKLKEHKVAITILAHDMRDTVSAETYCTLGGSVVSIKTANTIGEQYKLQQWSILFLPPKSPPNKQSNDADNGALKSDLFKILLEVYMSEGERGIHYAARLLDAQATNLDTLEAINSIPADWPLSVMSSFLSRSFRHTLHKMHEGQIVKSIASAQNYRVAEQSWLVLREQGVLLEEEGEGDDDETGESFQYDEKGILSEKLPLPDPPVHAVEAGS